MNKEIVPHPGIGIRQNRNGIAFGLIVGVTLGYWIGTLISEPLNTVFHVQTDRMFMAITGLIAGGITGATTGWGISYGFAVLFKIARGRV